MNTIQRFFRKWLLGINDEIPSVAAPPSQKAKECVLDNKMAINVGGVETKVNMNEKFQIKCDMALWELNSTELIEIMNSQNVVREEYNLYKCFNSNATSTEKH